MEKHITFTELIMVMLLFGSPVFIVGRIAQLFLFLKQKAPFQFILPVLIISQILALVIEIAIWYFFKTDPMFHFVSLPAVGVEILVLAATIAYIKLKYK